MDRTEFKRRMKSLKSYREQNPGKGYWDWRSSLPNNLKYIEVEQFQDGGKKKMAVFALNAKKWKYWDGGEIPPDNSPVRVNPITGKPLANGAVTPVFNLEDFANFTPVGDALSVRDAYIAARNRDLLGLGLAGLGIIPFVPRIGKTKAVRDVDVPTVDKDYFQKQFEEMQRRDAKKHEIVDDFYKQQDAVYESMIENEDAFRRAAAADASTGTNYIRTYTDMLRGYSQGTSRNSSTLPQIALTYDIPDQVKAQVDPANLDWIRINRRYTDPDELDPVFQQLNPGLVRHELGHIVDEKSGLEYVKKLGDRSKFESEDKLKEMYPSSYKTIQDYLLKGSEIKSHMNEFREFLYQKEEYSPTETTKSMRQKLDKYKDQFKGLNMLFDAYKSKRQFIKDYNNTPITATNSNKEQV